MKARTLGTMMLAAALLAAPAVAGAQAAAGGPPQAQAAQETIFGSQMMTVQERNEYRARMLAAKTAEERDRIRAEHHAQMVTRARERGVTLPDMPMSGRMGPGSGMGPGTGMGPGSGTGPGGGMGPGSGMGGGMGGGRR